MREQDAGAVPAALLTRLKRDTHAVHAALESRINLMDRIRTAADYRKLLEAFYGLFSPIEDRIRIHKLELAAWIPDIENRTRTAALRRDLHALGNIAPQDLPIAT